MKHLYIIYASLVLSACSGSSGATTESYSEAGERIVIAENEKIELAMVDIGKVCKEQGYLVISRGGSIVMKEGTRIVAKCGKESIKGDKVAKSWFSIL